MSEQKREVRPGPRDRTVRTAEGVLLEVPDDWALLPPGDAGVTRRVKVGPHWAVKERRGRRVFSQGIWAPASRIRAAQHAMAMTRSAPSYARKQVAAKKRRDHTQANYVVEFSAAVRTFLAFAPKYEALELKLAKAVATHATPVGSGTVARTARIPVEERAEAAVIAWMRHQTTVYDDLKIPRVKGMRRDVRRKLAKRSHSLLAAYRQGEVVAPTCPLQEALS